MEATTISDTDQTEGFFGRIGSTISSYVSATKSAIFGFNTRRKANIRQDKKWAEYNELKWKEIRGQLSDDERERKQELQDGIIEDQDIKVESWNRQPQEETQRNQADAILDDVPESTRAGVREELLPHYVNEEEEYSETRRGMMNRLEDLPTGAEYDDIEYQARMTDEDVRKRLFTSEAQTYGDGMDADNASRLADTAEGLRQEQSGDDDGPSNDTYRGYFEEQIDTIIDPLPEDDADLVENWLIPRYVNEEGDFGEDRDTMVDLLVEEYEEYGYEDLAIETDDGVRKNLFIYRVMDADTDLSPDDITEVAVYAEDLRNMDVQYVSRRPPWYEDDAEARTDGGGTARSAGAATTTETGPAAEPLPDDYIDENLAAVGEEYEVENEFMTTGYNTFQKVRIDDGEYQYLKNGEKVSLQSYAGASAHIPDA